MSKKPPLFTKGITCLLVVLFLQVFVACGQNMPTDIFKEIANLPQTQRMQILNQFENLPPAKKAEAIAILERKTPTQRAALYKEMKKLSAEGINGMLWLLTKGRMVFELNAKSAIHTGFRAINFEIHPELVAIFREGGVVYSVEFIESCPSPSNTNATAHIRILFPDKDRKNLFITNQREKTASIKIEGKVRRWERDCKLNIREIEGGTGKLEANFNTSNHTSPRNFEVNNRQGGKRPVAIGKFSGVGLNESLRPFNENFGGLNDTFIPAVGSTAEIETDLNPDSSQNSKKMQEQAKKNALTFTAFLVSERSFQENTSAVIVRVVAGSSLEAISSDVVSDDDKSKCDYFIATTGSDSNSGTSESPFATLQKALDEAKVCRDKNKAVSITIKNGTYRQAANVTWEDAETTPMLTIKGESADGVIFSATEVSDVNWKNSPSGFMANMPLHPEQKIWKPTNFAINPPPTIVVNEQRMTYVPAKNKPMPTTYVVNGKTIYLRPQAGVGNLNSATVEVLVRPYTITMKGAKNVTISNMTFRYFQTIGRTTTPGIDIFASEVTVQDLDFQ